ncbi:hypothetical protein AVL50_24795 [Flammeovirga sp. SJP92]|nr:hypothetical protein AVL50_24795 [Flammeovirga sp. SJP92]
MTAYQAVGQSKVIFSENFETNNQFWLPLSLDGSNGNSVIKNNSLIITAEESGRFASYYSDQTFSGHFHVDIEFSEDNHIGLALFKNKNGAPDLENYTLLQVKSDENNLVTVNLKDVQNGEKNVLDNTGKVKSELYKHTLTGTTYSNPFTATSKKLRILRHEGEQFFHFYYGVGKEVYGKYAENWMELPPSKLWGEDSEYFVGLVGVHGEAVFNKVTVTQAPLHDQSDLETGFKATWREYNWSGYSGNALVVSFDDNFEYAKEDKKFILWEQSNFVPAWHINKDTHYSYEFVETWWDGSVGCFEPMSDRLLSHSKVELLEDNAIRKVIHWHYVLMDPDYKIPDYEHGTQLPEVDEYYTIYANGTVIRRIEYTPKLDTSFRKWHELTEPMLIAGNNHKPIDLLSVPAVSLYSSFEDKMTSFDIRTNKDYKNDDNLGPTIIYGHIKDEPDAFNVFSDDASVPETFGGNKLNYKIDWHNANLRFAHWPINKEPYEKPHKSWARWQEQIAHTSLVGMGVYGGTDWKSNYLERENGRKYRKWLMMAGLSPKNNTAYAKDLTQSWLYSGFVIMQDDSCQFKGYSYDDRWFEFTALEEKASAYFNLSPDKKMVQPLFKINEWKQDEVYININGKNVSSEDYYFIKEDNYIIVQLKLDINESSKIKISSSTIKEENPITDLPSNDLGQKVKVIPNPVLGDHFSIESQLQGKQHLQILNLSGSVLLEKELHSVKSTIAVDGWTKGIYIVNLIHDRGMVSKKVVMK